MASYRDGVSLFCRCFKKKIKVAYVYRHIRLDKNVPFYIGIGKDDGGKYTRAYHTTSSRKKSIIWSRISDKTNYEVEIIIDNISWERACEKEKEFIKLYGRINLGTGTLANMTDGGEGNSGVVLTPKMRFEIGKAHRGKKQSAESNKKRSERLKGRVVTQETRDKLSIANKGKPVSEERRIYLSKINIGKKIPLSVIEKIKKTKSERTYIYIPRKKSEEEKRKIGDFHKGKRWGLGTKRTEEYKRNKSSITKTKKPVIKYSLDDVFICEYGSQREAAANTGIPKEAIGRACKGVYRGYKNHICKGYIWKYK